MQAIGRYARIDQEVNNAIGSTYYIQSSDEDVVKAWYAVNAYGKPSPP